MQPLLAPELCANHFTDTRIFLKIDRTDKWFLVFGNYLMSCTALHDRNTYLQIFCHAVWISNPQSCKKKFHDLKQITNDSCHVMVTWPDKWFWNLFGKHVGADGNIGLNQALLDRGQSWKFHLSGGGARLQKIQWTRCLAAFSSDKSTSCSENCSLENQVLASLPAQLTWTGTLARKL